MLSTTRNSGSRCSTLLAALMLCSAFARAEQSDDSAFMQLHSEHAFNAVFGLPAVAARPVASSEWQLSLEHSNQFIGSRAGDEQLLLDGETSELTLRHRQRLAACWQGEVALPFIAHGGGEFDRAIDDWHQFFGMPNGDRDIYPFDQLSYAYYDESGEVVRVDSPQSGIGDISVSVQRSLKCRSTADSTGSQAIVRLGVKLPTGNANELRGSGKLDTYVDLQSPVWHLGERFRVGATLGVMYMGQSDRLPPQRSLAGFGALGTQFKLTQRFRAMVQLDWHTPFYRSNLAELNDVSLKLSVGLRYLVRRSQSLELSISEDIAVDTAPDIVARLLWVYRPAPGR